MCCTKLQKRGNLQEEISLASRIQKRQFGTQKKISILYLNCKRRRSEFWDPQKKKLFCAKLQKEEV
jgi:hypothetical protein